MYIDSMFIEDIQTGVRVVLTYVAMLTYVSSNYGRISYMELVVVRSQGDNQRFNSWSRLMVIILQLF